MVFFRPIRSPKVPRDIAPTHMPTVLAVITQVMSVACRPKSSAIAGPMNAMDCVSNPSSNAITKQRTTMDHRLNPMGVLSITSWTL